MKVTQSVLLASAASFLAVAGAAAADLPSRKSAPVEYVKVCDAYGAGFFYIPGTDTCLRVGGYVRAEYAYVSPGKIAFVPNGTNGKSISNANATFTASGNVDQTGFMARGRVDLDARTQTAWGTVRTFIGVRLAANGGIYTTSGSAGAPTTGAVTGVAGGTIASLEQAIVQFAGFTFGRTTAETFTFMPGINYNNAFSWSFFPGGINMLAYTASFGGGVTATLSVEDRSGLVAATQPAFLGGPVVPPGTVSGGTVTNGPYSWPALVGNVRLDQGWGAAQLMGAVVQNSATSTFEPSAPLQKTFTQTGWAIGAGLKLNLPMLASGDTLYLTGAYADGGLDWLEQFDSSSAVSSLYKDFNGLQRRDVNMTVYGNGATIGTEQTSGYSFGGIFTHYWTPTIRTNLIASYLQLTPGNVTRHTDWTLGGLSSATVWQVGGQVVWSPVKDLNIGTELTYQRLNQRLTGNGAALPTAVPVSWGGFNPSSGVFQGRIRVDRLF